MRRIERVESVEDFAVVSARLADPFADRRAVLASAALDEPQWDAVRRDFGARLASAASAASAAAEPELCARFRRAFEGARDERRTAATPAPKTESAPPPPPPVAAAAPDPASTPSYLRADAAPRAMPSHMMGAPLRSATPSPISPPIAAPPIVAATPIAAATPIVGATPISAPPPALQRPASAPPPAIGVSFAPAAPAPAILHVGAPPSARPKLDGTALLSGPLPGVREATQLPFKQGAAELPKPAPSAAPRSSISTGTRMAPEGMPIRSVPFESVKRAEGNLTGWTVERYAALCIDLSISGRPRPDVLRNHGLDEERFAPLDAYWEGALAKDAALQRQWTEACARRRLALGR